MWWSSEGKPHPSVDLVGQLERSLWLRSLAACCVAQGNRKMISLAKKADCHHVSLYFGSSNSLAISRLVKCQWSELPGSERAPCFVFSDVGKPEDLTREACARGVPLGLLFGSPAKLQSDILAVLELIGLSRECVCERMKHILSVNLLVCDFLVL